jgi:hypothetical protein
LLYGSAIRFPGAPPVSSTDAADAAKPAQIVATGGEAQAPEYTGARASRGKRAVKTGRAAKTGHSAQGRRAGADDSSA